MSDTPEKVNLRGTLTLLLLPFGCKHFFHRLDFEDYDYDDNMRYYDKYYGPYGEECEHEDSYNSNNDFKDGNASRYDSFTYPSCDGSHKNKVITGLTMIIRKLSKNILVHFLTSDFNI